MLIGIKGINSSVIIVGKPENFPIFGGFSEFYYIIQYVILLNYNVVTCMRKTKYIVFLKHNWPWSPWPTLVFGVVFYERQMEKCCIQTTQKHPDLKTELQRYSMMLGFGTGIKTDI